MPENNLLSLVKCPVVVNNTQYPVKTPIRGYLKNYHGTLYSPFRFFFKKSDSLGQKVVKFFLGPPSPPYSMLKYLWCLRRNLPVHFLSFSRILQHWLQGRRGIEKSLLTFCPRLCTKGKIYGILGLGAVFNKIARRVLK